MAGMHNAVTSLNAPKKSCSLYSSRGKQRETRIRKQFKMGKVRTLLIVVCYRLSKLMKTLAFQNSCTHLKALKVDNSKPLPSLNSRVVFQFTNNKIKKVKNQKNFVRSGGTDSVIILPTLIVAVAEQFPTHFNLLSEGFTSIQGPVIRDFKVLTTDYEHARTLRNTMDDQMQIIPIQDYGVFILFFYAFILLC